MSSSNSVRILSTLLLAALALNWAQYIRLTQYRNAVQERASAPALSVGSVLPHFQALGRDGQRISIDFDPKTDPQDTILYYFAPDCVWSRRNSANINELHSRLAQTHRFIGVAPSPAVLDLYLSEHGHEFYVVTTPAKETVEAYRLSGTPHTLLIGPNGRVKRVWYGAYLGETLDKVQREFSISLPGVTQSN
jgi:hypothetical protein